MPSLRELQEGFIAAVLDGDERAIAVTPAADAAERIAIYRRAVFANYRNALRATYPAVAHTVGAALFDGAVDAFVRAHPSRCGDLNVYGAEFSDFLAGHTPVEAWTFLADLARLEWAIDEAGRAADVVSDPPAVLAALAGVEPARLPAARLALHPSCRIVVSRHAVLRRWRGAQGDEEERGAAADDQQEIILIRRDERGIPLERLDPPEGAWLNALAEGATLGAALDAALALDAGFELQAALASRTAAGTIHAVCVD
jgi:hypothetical protein